MLLLIESYKLDRFFKYILHLTFYSVCLLDPSAPYKHRVCLPRIEWLHRHHAPAHSNTLHLRLVCMYLCKSKLPPPKDLHTHTHTRTVDCLMRGGNCCAGIQSLAELKLRFWLGRSSGFRRDAGSQWGPCIPQSLYLSVCVCICVCVCVCILDSVACLVLVLALEPLAAPFRQVLSS